MLKEPVHIHMPYGPVKKKEDRTLLFLTRGNLKRDLEEFRRCDVSSVKSDGNSKSHFPLTNFQKVMQSISIS